MKIASLGGTEAIISAMSTHKDHIGVQQDACAALGSLASRNGMFMLTAQTTTKSNLTCELLTLIRILHASL
jgi:hypothetical protein